MVKQVVKRDGRVVPYDNQRIVNAISSAFTSCKLVPDAALCASIADAIHNLDKEQMSVEDIQDIVEQHLMDTQYKKVGKEYILYRNKRNIARKAKTRAMFMDIVNAKPNEVTRENANMNADTPAGMMMKFASETTKSFVDDYLLSDDVRELVKNNYIHIHDKDYYPTKSLTCVQHPLDKILKEGFSAGHGSSRPAKRIETASILGCISLETAQNEMHGGQAIPAFDFYLAPFVRKTYIEEVKKCEKLFQRTFECLYDAEIEDYVHVDTDQFSDQMQIVKHTAINNTVQRVHQAMEAFVHNMNTIHSRGGNQVVFSSINYGTDTSAEGRCIIREMLKTTYDGVGNHETAIFPIQIWKKKRGVNYLPGDRNYDLYELACKVTCRRFFPNFLNLDATYNQHELWRADDPERFNYEVATMGCRTRVFENRFGMKTSIGRGNLSFTTINIVKIAIEAAIAAGLICKKGDQYVNGHLADWEENKHKEAVELAIRLFFQQLKDVLDTTAKQLDERFQFQKTALAKQFPLLMTKLWRGGDQLKPNDTIEPVINQGTLGIGFIGLAECLVALTGHHHGESDEAQELGLRIIRFFKVNADHYCTRYMHNYSVLATPAEGLSGKFTAIDQKRYGKIEGVTDREYYTNSNHVPVYYKCDAEDKARIEAPYHALTGGGHIFYVELDGDATHNPSVVMRIVDMMDKYNMGYGSVNHNRSRCEDCGYEAADEFENGICPKCGSDKTTYLARITGYLTTNVNKWNTGKMTEFKDRVRHTGSDRESLSERGIELQMD